MKLLFLSVNASWTHSCLALYYLRNAIKDLDYQSEIIEITLKETISTALDTIITSQPDVLCLSVYIWNVEYLKKLVPEIRKLLPNLIVVTGGPEVSHNPQTADALKPDYLIKGYGESAFRHLAENRFSSLDKDIQGIPLPLDQVPFPYLNSDASLLNGKMLYYEASRGCACRCIYCLSSREEKVDWLPFDRVISDIDKLLLHQPKVIKFVDRSFNAKKDWARDIWRYVISLDTQVPFHFEVHPDWLEPEDIDLLATAPKGRIQLEIGIQTIHPATLQKICRPSDWDMVKANLFVLKERTSIPLHNDLLVGLPGENLHMIRQSVNEVLQTLPDELQLGFLKVLHGTQMAETAFAMNYLWLNSAPYTVLQTPDLSFADIRHLEKIAQIINQYWNKGDFTTVWKKAVTCKEPYQCLEQLLEINLSHDSQLHSLERVRRFEVMAEWINRCWSGTEHKYLADALRWDWCKKAGESWYPDALKGNTAIDFRKEHYQEILGWLKSEFWEQENLISNRFIVFSAISNDFCLDYLNGYTKAVFVSVKDSINTAFIYKKQY